MGKVILFGEPMALLIADTPGPLKDIEYFTRSMSGSEVNVAIGLTRLGHLVHYITRLGEDPFGYYIEEALKKDGISTSFISYDSVYRTGIQLKNRVIDGSDPQAPYYRKNSAASKITVKEIDEINFEEVDLVHVTGIPPALSKEAREATFRLMERARENKIFITFDPNLRPALWESREVMIEVINELAKNADIVLPGIEECEILVGSRDYDEIAKFYMERGAKQIILKIGSKGAYVNTGKESFVVPGFKVEKVVDTVGAGDGFAVGVISGYLEGLDIKEMARRGNAIGAIQVTNISDNQGLPTHSELELFMNK